MPHLRLVWWSILLAVSILLGVATWDPFAQYVARWVRPPNVQPARNLAAEEENWFRVVNAFRSRHAVPVLAKGEQLHQAALGHSVDMLRHDFFEVDSPQRGTHQYRIWQTGITESRVYCYIFKTNTPSLADTITSNKSFVQNLLNPQLTHIGVGIVSGATRDPLLGEVQFITVEVAERYISLTLPGSGHFSRRETVNLSGTVTDGLRDPRLVVTQPEGRIVTRYLAMRLDRSFQVALNFAGGAGEYKVEVEADNKMGPLVTNLFPIYVDVPWPDPVADYRRARQRDTQSPLSLEEAKQLMFYLINEERRKVRLPPVRYSFALENLALRHSQDMHDHDFFAHVSPRLGDLETRARANNLHIRLVAENIAIDQSVRKAHESLMGSPSHRSNILQPRMTHVGIGIVSGNDRRYGKNALWITQHFALFAPSGGTSPP